MSTYSGVHLTFGQQLQRLKGRGLEVADDDAALQQLQQLGYYRLSAYWYPMRQSGPVQIDGILGWEVKNEFAAGASFEQAVALYQFDKKLRVLLMEAIERIEVALRVHIAYSLSAHSIFAQEDPSMLDGNFTFRPAATGRSKHDDWLLKLSAQVDKSKEEFVSHYKRRYGLPLPIWVVIEVWDFGLLSHFYAGMRYVDQSSLAERFSIPSPDVAKSWLRTVNYVRNIVAHHSRVWNRGMVENPKFRGLDAYGDVGSGLAALDASRPYAAFCVIAYLERKMLPHSDWCVRFSEHLESFPADGCPKIQMKQMGCLPGWREHALWADNSGQQERT
ncbi:Abi family protein [Xanthomonas hortorum pv. vitians]|uniref:Abi family protein n=1 Tax=Xanthomonas hortorum TaxID=56454 RepID=UPI001F17189F|nr:Abi family protein [Xanthomonas hortorum]MCE4304310.1 Abi family protein [Xanthomonas hortorum pv. vitians]